MNPLQQLRPAGQSVWLDFLRRGLLTGGTLERMIDEDGLAGVTSNPSIFAKAIGGSTDYEGAIRTIVSKGDRSPVEVFYDLALADIQMAADVLRPVHERTGGADGFVSFELEPRLAHDVQGSIEAAGDLSGQIGKPNVMIKIPGTEAGIAALGTLIAAGVNVNVTLLFSVDRYEEIALAYLNGLERRLEAGEPLDGVASVASFFVSRVDTAVDPFLPEGSLLRGKAAVANAKLAYQRFRRIFSGPRWDRLAAAGARVQRPLWASTSTKDPAYRDVLYVEELVGPDTVNTMPGATLDAFRDHGRVRPGAVTEDVEGAQEVISRLPEHGIDLAAVTARLLDDGLRAFDADLQKLLATIEARMEEARAGRARLAASLPTIEGRLADRLERMADDRIVPRIWRRDHTVWKPEPTEIGNRLGWLTIAETMRERVGELERFADRAAADGLRHAILLGMGGSSLAPEMLRRTYGVKAGSLDLRVLDTTHPAAIAALERSIDLERTLFIVASKSGRTVETLSHFAYFHERVPRGDRFVAITDPATPLEALARTHGFRAVFTNPADIGGRYSALSLFGLVPGALIGADLSALLDAAEEMACACDPCVPVGENPGAWLGAAMAEAALGGRDKLTLVLPPEIAAFGDWAEQLIAESTGKEGTGIVPIVGEDLGGVASYGSDRLFVSIGDHDGLSALEEAGHPVIRLAGGGTSALGAELFRLEFATAVAGHVLGINAFDQPNVEEAKRATREILEGGADEDPGFDNPAALLEAVGPGDYVSLQAYVAPSPENERALGDVRLAIRDRYRVATTLGFGPRFLHSTGQLHKGGPSTGAFLQVVDPERELDLPIPGEPYTFGALIDAQALGDLRSLRARGRRVARVTLEQLMEVV